MIRLVILVEKTKNQVVRLRELSEEERYRASCNLRPVGPINLLREEKINRKTLTNREPPNRRKTSKSTSQKARDNKRLLRARIHLSIPKSHRFSRNRRRPNLKCNPRARSVSKISSRKADKNNREKITKLLRIRKLAWDRFQALQFRMIAVKRSNSLSVYH